MNTVLIACLAGVAVLVLLCGVGWWCFRKPAATPSPVYLQGGSGPAAKVQLIKASWCPHCKSMVPIFEELVKQDPSKYEIIDGPQKGSQWLKTNDIKAYPAIRLYRTANGSPEIMYGPKTKQQVLSL